MRAIIYCMTLALLSFFSCKHHPDLFPQTVLPPSNLIYNSNAIQIQLGSNVSSQKPEIAGDQPINFTIATSPISLGAISINNEGIISADSTLEEGVYNISITATNAGGGVSFQNVYQITVTKNSVAPSNLQYSADTLFVNYGDSAVSVIPTVSGTTPMNFSYTSTPAESRISIHEQGQLKAASGLPLGAYKIHVSATNTAGTALFNNALVIKVVPVKPSALTYSPNSLNIVAGYSGASVVPTINGTTPITYSISSSPSNANITIGSTGQITASNVPVGTYSISVTATNAGGSTLFNGIYSVKVTSSASVPSGLVYATNSLSMTKGQTASSVVPKVEGTTPIGFSLSTSPASTGNITIDSKTGIITASSSLASGTYSINVTASNSAGATSFSNAYSITVTEPVLPSGLTYTPASYTINQGATGSSVTPVISGTKPVSYTIAVAPANANITINSTSGVISSNSSLQVGTYYISVTATNAAGNTTFSNIYTVFVNTPPTTYTKDIKPLVLANCSNCHTGGGQTNYTIYSNTSRDIDLILDRVQRLPQLPGYMPKSGTALTAAQINLLKQWKAQGLLQ